MSEKKTILPSLRNLEWKTVETETERINELLTYSSRNNITELNKLIFAGEKLVSDKIDVPLKTTNKNANPRLRIRLKTQIRNLRQ